MGSYLSIVNDTSDTYSVKIGADASAVTISGAILGSLAVLASAGTLAPVVGGVVISTGAITVGTGISIASGISAFALTLHSELEKQGYVTLKPGERKKYGKMTLSLWQQCECIRTRRDGNDAVTEVVYMRPIFSGATNDSNLDHSIQYWVNKVGGHLEETSRLRAVYPS